MMPYLKPRDDDEREEESNYTWVTEAFLTLRNTETSPTGCPQKKTFQLKVILADVN